MSDRKESLRSEVSILHNSLPENKESAPPDPDQRVQGTPLSEALYGVLKTAADPLTDEEVSVSYAAYLLHKYV